MTVYETGDVPNEAIMFVERGINVIRRLVEKTVHKVEQIKISLQKKIEQIKISICSLISNINTIFFSCNVAILQTWLIDERLNLHF